MNASATTSAAPERTTRRKGFWVKRRWWGVAAVLILGLGAVGWLRSGMLDLPSVPRGLTCETAGLSGLERMKALDGLLWATNRQPAPKMSEAATRVQRGIAAWRRGHTGEALEQMRQGIRLEPNNLVLGNAYRMVVFKLRRDFLTAARRDGLAAPHFPAELDREPIAFFQALDHEHPTRETTLQLALAWVDEMLLFPALEIKAPSSVEAVNLLTGLIRRDGPGYVPALFARGLNHLHRPARLVWPESEKTPKDAAARDIGLCVAIGRKLGAGSPRLQATLALSLGDAYVKTGRLGVARSWWQIAQNLCRDADFQESVRRRYSWLDEEILDRLEEELDRCRAELEHPMTDLALMWN